MKLNNLTEEEKRVIIDKGTEMPFSGKYYAENSKGIYKCKACDNILFSSGTKYHSDTPGLAGWPSFNDALPDSVEHVDDNSLGIHRTEIICSKCKSHLGHIFDDTDSKTGKHYCINSICLNLEKEDGK